MCFRPADAAGGAQTCPECGKPVQAMGGIVLKNCPFCKADFSKYMNADGTPKGAPAAPAAPGAPSAPAAPGAPKPPVA